MRQGKARIDFDWFCTDFDLCTGVQERLRAEHAAYCKQHFGRGDYRDGVSGSVSTASLALDVLARDAEDWFAKVLSVLTKESNFMRLTFA